MVSFPLYVRDDAGDVTCYGSLENMQGYMEPTDVESSEYEAWDSFGNALELSVGKPKSEWLKIAHSGCALSEREFIEIKAKAVPYKEPEPMLKGLARALGIVRNDPES